MKTKFAFSRFFLSLTLLFAAAGFNYSYAESDFSAEAVVSKPIVPQEGDLNIYFLSVGQGDAIYIELPNGSNALIDGGANAPDIDRFFAGRGVKAINHVVLTHPHADHYVGLQRVFDVMKVKNFYDTKCAPKDPLSLEMVTALRKKAASGSKVYFPADGGKFNWSPGVAIRVLNGVPTQELADINAKNINNCSIVIQLTYEKVSVLLTGDADEQVNERIAQEYGSSVRSLMLKVPHHGDANAMTPNFIKSVKPKFAVISVGRNSFGHPRKEAIDILKNAGATVLRTDGQGTMQLTIRNGVALPIVSVAPPSTFVPLGPTGNPVRY